jgi:2'-5' RNA ligase
VRLALCAWCERVAPAAVRRVPAENLHVTLACLGKRPASEVSLVGPLLADVARARVVGELETAGARWLPQRRRPGVLTVALSHEPGLVALHAAVVSGLADAIGFLAETRPFLPHVTVGSISRGALRRAVELEAPPELAFGASSLTLYRSLLGAGGARYEPLARVQLP